VIDVEVKSPKTIKADKYDRDSLTCIMSSGKSVASILLAVLADGRRLSYSDKVSSLWPEYGVNNKENITVQDVMRHEGGMYRLHKQLLAEDAYTENIKQNSIGKVIETDTGIWPPGHVRQYHGVSRDWISNEIFRRLEPNNRTMGEYLRDELSSKHKIDIICGCKPEELSSIVPFQLISPLTTMKGMWKGPSKAPVLCSFKQLPGYF
jgi:hypothetical protein